jgi:hypothetical protein
MASFFASIGAIFSSFFREKLVGVLLLIVNLIWNKVMAFFRLRKKTSEDKDENKEVKDEIQNAETEEELQEALNHAGRIIGPND